MPSAGLKFKTTRRRYRFGGTGNAGLGTENIGCGFLVRGSCRFTEDPNDVKLGIVVYAYSQLAGAGPINTTQTTYGIFSEPLGIDPAQDFTQAGVFTNVLEGYLDIIDLAIYEMGTYYRFQCSDIRLYRGTTLLYSHGPASYDGAANKLAASYVPIVGFGYKCDAVPYVGIATPV